jgi:hypothetical protein
MDERIHWGFLRQRSLGLTTYIHEAYFDGAMSPNRKRYSFWINEAEAQGLKAIKEAEGTTESEQIRQAIRDWLKKKGIRDVAPRRSSKQRKI